MALADVVVKAEDQLEYAVGEKGRVKVTGKRTYWCLTDNKFEPYSVVSTNTQIWPKIGNRPLERVGNIVDWGGVPSVVKSRSFAYVKDNERLIQVDLTYEGWEPDELEENDRPEEDESTWLRLTISSSQISKPATDEDGRSFANSAGDPVDGLEAEAALMVLTYANEAAVNPKFKEFYKYLNACNDDEYLGCEPYTLRCTGISAEYDQAKQAWRVSVEFTHNPDGWEIVYYDAGFNEIVDGKRRAILDDRGNPVNQPVPLDGEGKALAPAAGTLVSDTTDKQYFKAGDAVTLKARPYKEENFRNLFTDLRI
jgi:hypothetical protein